MIIENCIETQSLFKKRKILVKNMRKIDNVE